MRSTSLAAALALLIIGCGFDGDPTAPEDPELTLPNPELALAEPELAAAAATTNVWTTRAPLPSRRAGLGLGVVNGVIYAVGGVVGDDTRLKTVQAYTPGTNMWATKASLPAARSHVSAIGTINGVLYVAGGINAQGAASDTLFAYNPADQYLDDEGAYEGCWRVRRRRGAGREALRLQRLQLSGSFVPEIRSGDRHLGVPHPPLAPR